MSDGTLLFDNAQHPVGIEIFTFGERAGIDFEGCLRDAAAIGYGEVELIGYVGRNPETLAKLFAAAGLRCPGIKYPPRTWLPGQLGLDDDLDQILRDADTLGLDYIVAMMFRVPDRLWQHPTGDAGIIRTLTQAPQRMTAEDWKHNAEALNRAGARVKRAGFDFAFHNSNLDFTPLDDTCGFELLLAHTDPSLVSFEMDVGYLVAAGHDPFDFIARHPGRFTLMHMKDIGAKTTPNTTRFENEWTELGSGIVDWPRLLPLAREAGIRHFFVEQEPPFRHSPFESARINCNYLRRLPLHPA